MDEKHQVKQILEQLDTLDKTLKSQIEFLKKIQDMVNAMLPLEDRESHSMSFAEDRMGNLMSSTAWTMSSITDAKKNLCEALAHLATIKEE